MPPQRPPHDRSRFGIGEWYGKLFDFLTPVQRRSYASIQLLPKAQRPPQECPFQRRPGLTVMCGKPGGVCSLRLYKEDAARCEVSRAPNESLRTLCPKRFQEDGTIYRWVFESRIRAKLAAHRRGGERLNPPAPT